MNKQKKNIKNQKRLHWSIPVACCILAIIAVLAFPIQQKKSADKEILDESVEKHLLRSASVVPVDLKFRPVLIYRFRGTNRPAFTAVGTLFEGKNGPLVATVEHLLQKKFINELFLLRSLSPDEHQITNGIQSIAYRNVQAGLPEDTDVIFLQPGDPVRIECFSERSESISEKTQAYLFNPVQVGGREVKNLRSLLTGKEYTVIGASKSPRFILIEYNSLPGESGSGFVDEYGQLYVLSGSTRNGSNPVSFLSGPFADPGKRL